MNFTREPIIETVIMPREGCKLLVRSSKGGQEEYYVDSIEVVSFGRSFFFRSQERPRSFLVPVSDYEILEQKEVRMPLKNVSPERSIKIGGGRDTSVRSSHGPSEVDAYEPQEREHPERPPQERTDRKRDKRRRGRRGGSRVESNLQEMRESSPIPVEEPYAPMDESIPTQEAMAVPAETRTGEEPKAPSFISKLFPPPPTLIKDSLSRYKTAESVQEEEQVFEKEDKIDDLLLEQSFSSEKEESDEEPPFMPEKGESEEEEPPFKE